jgi:hypothetical protein
MANKIVNVNEVVANSLKIHFKCLYDEDGIGAAITKIFPTFAFDLNS